MAHKGATIFGNGQSVQLKLGVNFLNPNLSYWDISQQKAIIINIENKYYLSPLGELYLTHIRFPIKPLHLHQLEDQHCFLIDCIKYTFRLNQKIQEENELTGIDPELFFDEDCFKSQLEQKENSWASEISDTDMAKACQQIDEVDWGDDGLDDTLLKLPDFETTQNGVESKSEMLEKRLESPIAEIKPHIVEMEEKSLLDFETTQNIMKSKIEMLEKRLEFTIAEIKNRKNILEERKFCIDEDKIESTDFETTQNIMKSKIEMLEKRLENSIVEIKRRRNNLEKSHLEDRIESSQKFESKNIHEMETQVNNSNVPEEVAKPENIHRMFTQESKYIHEMETQANNLEKAANIHEIFTQESNCIHEMETQLNNSKLPEEAVKTENIHEILTQLSPANILNQPTQISNEVKTQQLSGVDDILLMENCNISEISLSEIDFQNENNLDCSLKLKVVTTRVKKPVPKRKKITLIRDSLPGPRKRVRRSTRVRRPRNFI